MDCECLVRCPFFNDLMNNMPSSAELLKRTYCYRDWDRCARYMVFKVKGSAAVPADLFPSQIDAARELLRES